MQQMRISTNQVSSVVLTIFRIFNFFDPSTILFKEVRPWHKIQTQ
jgi:hypothetical protein